jgi:uroporphyrinogen-III synthase
MSDPTGDGARLAEEGADWIVFASGMAIEHFHARFDLPKLMARFPGTRLAIANVSIKWALDKLRLKPAVIAQSNDVENLVNAITKAMHSDVFSTISGESRMNETDRLPEVCAIS